MTQYLDVTVPSPEIDRACQQLAALAADNTLPLGIALTVGEALAVLRDVTPPYPPLPPLRPVHDVTVLTGVRRDLTTALQDARSLEERLRLADALRLVTEATGTPP
jgi:hypothetical protein